MRPKLALLAVVAFLTTLFSPVRTSWACPDGTACVSHGHGYVCAGGHGGRAACCVMTRPCECKHGDLPGASRPHSATAGIDAPDHCRFSVSGPPSLRAAAGDNSPVLHAAPHALLTPAGPLFVAPAPIPAWRADYALGYRPPPLAWQGPSRAPPAA